MMNGPFSEMPASEPLRWYDVWQEAILHPSPATFERILADPTASPGRAFTWVALLAVVGGLIQAFALPAAGPGLEQSISLGFALGCGVIGGPLIAVIGLALSGALLHWIAGLFGGTGTFNRMVYVLGAVSAPASLFSYVLSGITLLLGSFTANGSGSMLSLCLLPVSLAFGIYVIYAQVQSIRAAERLDGGKAFLTLILPSIIAVVIGAACFFLALIPLLANTGNFR